MTSVDICICTFRRAHIADTLRSLAQMPKRVDIELRVIVADNDDTPSAHALVEAMAAETALNITYIHAPARNISIARNACLDAAIATFVAFIDDDELVTPQWLDALLTKQAETKAEVVMGPVHASYRQDCSAWIKKGDFHSTFPVFVNGEIITSASCNILFERAAPMIINRRFRIDLGRSGGEDSAFFSGVHQAGGRIVYAPNALVTEEVPQARATLTWLVKRKFRFGQSHAMLMLESKPIGAVGRLRAMGVAAVKGSLCFGMAIVNVFKLHRMMFWVLRGVLHVGVISRLLGKREIEQYGGEKPA